MSFEERYRQRVAEARAAFVERAAAQAVRLRQLAAAGDGVAIRDIAHQLRGTAGTIGFEDVSDQAGALEDAIDSGDSSLPDLAEALAASLEGMDDA